MGRAVSATAGLAVGVLGDLQVVAAGRRVDLGGPVPRRLFTHLALLRNEVLSREALIDRLWADEPPETADKTIQVYVSRFRHRLGEAGQRLVTSASGYRLELGDDDLDLARAERDAVMAEEALAAGQLADSLMLSDRALALWRGPALADLHDHLALGHKARIEELRLRLEHARVDAEIASGHADTAIARLEPLVREHPVRERLWVQLMFAQVAAGRQGDALSTFLRARSMLREELGTDPGQDLVDAQRLVLEQRPLPTTTLPARSDAARRRVTRTTGTVAADPRGPVRLPEYLDAMIGRGREIEDVARHLERGRLVTLVGPGGVGKTRLAVEVARCVQDRYPGGSLFIDLAAVRDPGRLLEAVLRAVDRDAAVESPSALEVASALGERDTLLILDNLEQIKNGAPAAVALLQEAPRVRILATSRAPLRVRGELLAVVEALAIGHAASAHVLDDPVGNPALALFAARAGAAGTVITERDAATAAEICVRLDGLPLALELAAARSRALGLDGLLRQLRSRLSAPDDGPRDLPERHRTLRATIDWSVDLLGDDARRLFPRLSLLAGSFDLAAVGAVGGLEPDQVPAPVAELVDHSLLARVADGATGPRYRLLETIRQEAAALLDPPSMADGLRGAIGHWHGVSAAVGGQVIAGDQAGAILRLEADLDSIRAALDLAAGPGAGHLVAAIEIVARLRRFWDFTGRSAEASQLQVRFLDLGGPGIPAPARALALNQIGTSWLAVGQHHIAAPYLEEALRLRRAAGDPADLSATLSNLALVRRRDGDFAGMRSMMEEAVALSRDAGDAWGVAAGLGNLGVAALEEGDSDAAERWYRQALDAFEALGDRASVGMVLDSLGSIALTRGDLVRAQDLMQRSWDIAEELGNTQSLVPSGINLARVRLLRGDGIGARAMATTVSNAAREAGDRFACTEAMELWAQVAAAEGRDTDATLLLAVADRRREREGWPINAHERATWRDALLDGIRERLGETTIVGIMGDAFVVDGDALLAAQVAPSA